MNTVYRNSSAGFLYNKNTHEVLLHKRDSNTKHNPHKWAFFGGAAEGLETPVECFLRELEEEISLKLLPENAIYLRDYLNTELNVQRHVFYAESDVSISELQLGEGADMKWVALSDVWDYDLTTLTRSDLQFFVENFL